MTIEAACGTGACITEDSVYETNVSLSYAFVEIDAAAPFTNALNSNGLNLVSINYANGKPKDLVFPDL